MEHPTFWKLVGRIILALVIGALAAALFHSVLPSGWAELIGLCIAVAEFAAGLFTSQHTAGGGIRTMLRMGEVTLSWPIAAWIVYGIERYALNINSPDRGVQIGLGAACAALVGMAASRHGYGHESARLVSVLIACVIPAGVMLFAIAGSDHLGVLAAIVACAIAPVTAGVAHVWPDGHHLRLQYASMLCVAAGAAVMARLIF